MTEKAQNKSYFKEKSSIIINFGVLNKSTTLSSVKMYICKILIKISLQNYFFSSETEPKLKITNTLCIDVILITKGKEEMVIKGYVLKNNNNMEYIHQILNDIKTRIQRLSEAEYYRMLGTEAAFLTDKITLGQIQQPTSIMESALNNLNSQISAFSLRQIDSPYNMKVFVHIMNHEGNTYFNVLCSNDVLLKAFKSPLEECSVSEDECFDKQNAKTKIWTKLHSIYDKSFVYICDLSADVIKTLEEVDRNKIKYPTVYERKKELSRENVFNFYLSSISMGQQINPIRLYTYIDAVFDKMASAEGQIKIREQEQKLHMLIDLNENDTILYNEETKQ